MSKNIYYEVLELIDQDKVDLLVDYDEWQIWIDFKNGKYYYVETGENDADTAYEVQEIARLSYSVEHDLKIPHDKAGIIMSELFDCCCCGECVTDDEILYLWFDLV